MSEQAAPRTKPLSEADVDRELDDLEAAHERNRRWLRARVKEVREELDNLSVMLAAAESTSRERAAERDRLRARLQNLARERQRNREVREAGLDEIRGQLDRVASAAELASATERVAGIGEGVRRAQRDLGRRRRRPGRWAAIPLA